MSKMLTALITGLFAGLCWAADPVDLNSATADQLASGLNGVGKAKAEAIVKDRELNGPFKTVDDLARVKGIGQATVDKNKDKMMALEEKAAPPSTPAPQSD